MSRVSMDTVPSDNTTFDAFAVACQRHHLTVTDGDAPLFTTDASNLWDVYLDGFDSPAERQHHDCTCCRHFIQRFGNLVVIDDAGSTRSAIWNAESVGMPFTRSAKALEKVVRRAKVTGVFVTKEALWGTPVTGPWHHFSISPRPGVLHRGRAVTAHQAMAQKKQDFGTLSHGLADFDRRTVADAINLLNTDTLYRSEKVRGPAQFLLDLHDRIAGIKGERKRNLIWKAVATAPVGFCTPRSSMIGTLLEDIAAGKSLETVKRSFAAKMNPLQYRRPSAPASTGNIDQAEKLIEKLGIQNSFLRRFARLEELKLIWSPTAPARIDKNSGMFAHLREETAAPTRLVPSQKITWTKFRATVLPVALKIEAYVDGEAQNFGAITTATDPDAPPILQWDLEEARNPFSWYVWVGGSHAYEWGLTARSWVEVTGVTLRPSLWGGEERNSHHGNGALLALKGARETKNAGLALFPECLKPELHSIRSTIEAFSRRGKIEGVENGTASGLIISNQRDTSVRVTTAVGVATYTIDRWD